MYTNFIGSKADSRYGTISDENKKESGGRNSKFV